MKLTREQSRKLLQERGIWVTNACDKCGQLLGAVRFTPRGEPGEWCSAACREGINTGRTQVAETAACCEGCGTSLHGKRGGAKFCSDTCRKRSKKARTREKAQNIPETHIQNSGLMEVTNSESTNTLTPPAESLETARNRNPQFEAGVSPR
jgi:hypothetical protein